MAAISSSDTDPSEPSASASSANRLSHTSSACSASRQMLVLANIEYYGFLLAPPRDDRRGLVPTRTIEDVRKVAANLGR
ncbi:hypothetical protein KCMC57_up34620 [Kitasatospora sp. CMC57]|uniref:Uncharacterized protein n=1 Tax=Kitasatospora sp. CMC57 TaxID=3231513 RepID=A0AB33JWN3_9ACTN